jgi:hypothetical protein
MADDRFEMAHEEEEPIGILIGMDKMFHIMSNEATIHSPCGLRAFQTKLRKMINNIIRFEKKELIATNFDLSLFWKIENFKNLENADAV